MGNSEKAEQQVLQGMNAEKYGNFKQAIMHYRQALEYLPESVQARQLLAILIKVHHQDRVEVVDKQEACESSIAERENSSKTSTSSSMELPVEKKSEKLKPDTNSELVNPAFSSNNTESMSPQTNKFVLLPAIDRTLEPTPAPEEMSAAEVYIAQALLYFEQNQLNESIAAVTEALRVYPEMGVAYKIWGNCLQRQGKSAEAIGIYAKALEAKADMAEIYCNLGSIYARQKKWQSAIEHYQKSIIINPEIATPYRNLARVWDELKEYDKSADCFFNAINLQPDLLSPQNHFNLANNLLAEGNRTQAIACYQSCIELEPKFLNAYARLADALEEDGQQEKALFYYKKLARLQTEPELAPTQSKSSQQISSLLKPAKAMQSLIKETPQPRRADRRLRRLAGIRPRTALHQEAIAITSAKQLKRLPSVEPKQIPQLQSAKQTPTDKIERYQQAASEQPNSAAIQFTLGNLYLENKQAQKAIACYVRATRLAPQEIKYYITLGRALEQTGNHNRANLAYYQGFSIQPQKVSAKNHYLLGDKLLQQNEGQKAIASYRRAISIKPELIEAYWRLGEIAAAKGDAKTALAYYQRALKIAPNRVQNYILVAKTLTQQGNWSAAKTYYQKALTLEPNNAEIHAKLGEAQINLQRYEDAVKTLQQAIGHNPQLWLAYHLLGDALSQQKLWQKAVGAYEKAILFNSNSYSLTHYCLGLAHLELKQYPEAVKALNKSIELDNSSSWSYYHLGSALCILEQWSEAAEALAKSIELNPNFDWAYHKLGNAKAEIEDWDGAVNAYKKALEITPDLPKTEDRLNDALRQRSKLDLEQVTEYYQTSLERDPQQESAYFKALEVSPDEPEIYAKLAKFYQSQGNSEQAIAFYKIALQIQPDNLETETALNELQTQLS